MTRNIRLLRAVILAFFVPVVAMPVLAQRNLKDIPVPDAELERKTFRLPEGFEVNLFAADPTIAKPIQMNFDESGRLWIVSSEVYPHIKPGEPARDRVLVVEDLDNDGVSDRTQVFAEGLLIPTGVAPGDGGAYVANSTQLIHFKDEDGDLKADSKQIVLSGFGTEDTHHILHTLRWGPDGYLYFNQSIYIHSHIETPWGVRRLNAGGIWQFRPETLELGVFMRGLVNSWGHHFDRFGQSFATDGAGGEGINYVVPGAYYFTAADAPQILHGLNPGSPKHCGLEIVETPMLPPDWQGSAITNDFRGHRVCRFNLTRDRSGYVSREQKEVIWSDHVAFRPIDVKLGPDGAIYIADWYNPIIQHGEVDFRDPRRDHTHGRIWRVSWKGAPKRAAGDLHKRSNAELFELLTEKDNFRRQAARQILRQRGDEVLDDLKSWVAGIPVDASTEHLRLEALWCFQSLRQVNMPLLEQLLNAEDARVRAAAVRALSHWKFYAPQKASDWFASAVNDIDPQVRLEAVRGVAFSPNGESELLTAAGIAGSEAAEKKLTAWAESARHIETVLQATDHSTDRFIDYAIWLTTRELSGRWLPAFQKGEIDFGGNVSHLLTAFSAVGQGAPVEFLLGRLYASETSAAQRTQVVDLVAANGTVDQIASLVKAAAAKRDAGVVRRIVSATRSRNLNVALSTETVGALLDSDASALRQAGLVAIGQWNVPSAGSLLNDAVQDAKQPIADRMAAAEGIALSGSKDAAQQLAQFTQDKANPTVLRKHAAALLTGLRPAQGAKVTAALLPSMTKDDHPEDLIRSFMAVKNGDSLLAESLSSVKLDPSVALEMLRVVRESGRVATELETTIRKSGDIKSRKSISAQEKAALLELAQTKATAAEGEQIFRNPKLGCLKCHAIGGAGGKVGPDMVSLGGSAQPDYLLESLLNPNAKVKENYHTIIIATDSGKLLSGVQVKQSKEEVVIRNAEDQLITVPRSEIEEIGQGLSLMPEGQVDTLTDGEIAALVRFLSELGRTPEYTISRRQLARTWRVMRPTPEAAYRLRRTSFAMAATDDAEFQWDRAYSSVSGVLPLTDVPVVSVRNRSADGSRGVGFVRCHLVVETAGQVSLNVNSFDGLELRVNEDPIDPGTTVSFQVSPGVYRLTFAVDHSKRSQPLELEIDSQGTTAVVVFEN